mmetsp:Transcript_13433/g.36612  ORF Transcript_13433/g.36612 Transcript_13433/m.36612 type:complete len:222 (-) Transcript_13433:404-1069(-)
MTEGRAPLHPQVAACVQGLGLVTLLEGNSIVIGEGAHCPLRELRVGDIHAHKHHPLRGEVVQHEAADRFGGEIWHAPLAGERTQAEGVVTIGCLMEEFADHSIGIKGPLSLLDLFVRCLHLPREQTGEEHVADHEGDDERYELAHDVHLVNNLLTARRASRGTMGAQLLERLHSAEVAQVRGGCIAHHRDHVRDPEVGRGLKATAGTHVQTEVGSEALLVH